jgi:hypothetical protein
MDDAVREVVLGVAEWPGGRCGRSGDMIESARCRGRAEAGRRQRGPSPAGRAMSWPEAVATGAIPRRYGLGRGWVRKGGTASRPEGEPA